MENKQIQICMSARDRGKELRKDQAGQGSSQVLRACKGSQEHSQRENQKGSVEDDEPQYYSMLEKFHFVMHRLI